MKRFIKFSTIFTLTAIAFVASSNFSQAQLKKGTNTPLPKAPLTVAQPPVTPQPGAFVGYVNGKVSLVQFDSGQFASIPGKKGAGTYKIVGKTIDLKSNLAQLWNLNRNAQKQQIADMLKKPIDGHRLYDANITVATASASNRLFMAITPSSKTVALHYFIPGNKVVCQADVKWWFDPTVTITFDLDLTMVLQTNGGSNSPLVLKSATLSVYNAKVRVNSDRNKGAEDTINKTRIDVRSKLQPAIALLNSNSLQPFTSQGFGVVTPMHSIPGVNTTSDLVLQLSRSPRAVALR